VRALRAALRARLRRGARGGGGGRSAGGGGGGGGGGERGDGGARPGVCGAAAAGGRRRRVRAGVESRACAAACARVTSAPPARLGPVHPTVSVGR
jgi:hypothetical protein